MLESRNEWLLYRILEDFLGREPVTVLSLFEHIEGDDEQEDTILLSHFL